MGRRLGDGGTEQRGKGLTDMGNNVVIAGGREGIRGLIGNGKNTVKIKFLKKNKRCIM